MREKFTPKCTEPQTPQVHPNVISCKGEIYPHVHRTPPSIQVHRTTLKHPNVISFKGKSFTLKCTEQHYQTLLTVVEMSLTAASETSCDNKLDKHSIKKPDELD
ncbi:hypothetical protein Dimus_006366 [Dionaea muscipula]